MSMIGKSLAHYSITAQLGKGGMGEVYQAKDQKLGRDVAIKVLPEEFARDTDRIARFQREAKLLASLNHPNIASIYGLEESEGTHFLVLELIEGETLADRIKGGPVPVEEALKLGLQIAEALEAAHDKGVIHRDLKPANIKITPDGKVKVLDFGLAKAYAGEREQTNLSNSPTLSDAATQQGMILGTAAYMSPEQARGKPVDKRTDIWAFGCVLYEMLTGKAAFQGEDVTEILASVVKSEVNLDLLPAGIHPRVHESLSRCLQKDQKDRYRDIGDVRFDLKQVQTDPHGVFIQPAPAAANPRLKSKQIFLWASIPVILLLIAGIVFWNLKTSETQNVMRFLYEVPEGQQLPPSTGIHRLGVSQDGEQIAYCTWGGLYVRSLDELNAKLIPGSDEISRNPLFTPDGKSVVYFSPSDQKLKKIAISGGSPIVLCEAGGFGGGSWQKDNFIVYSSAPNGIMRVSSNGGAPENLVKQKSGQLFNPQILPDGKTVIYTSNILQSRIVVQTIHSEKPKELFAGWFIRYLPSGYIVYLDSGGNLCVVRFDMDRFEAVGESVPIVPNVEEAAVSDSGTLLYTLLDPQGNNLQYTLVWVDKEGREKQLEALPNGYDAPKISPDGKQVAVTIGFVGSNDIWIWDIDRKNLRKLTLEPTNEIQPIWTPDNQQIIYFSDQDENAIYRRQADGSGQVEKLISLPDHQLFPFSISSDGKTLLVQELVTWTNADISMLPMEGDRKKISLLHDEYNEEEPRISPNGEWLAYSSDESGNPEVFVRPFPEVDKGKKQVSNGGGNCPLWSPDGKELYYLSADNVVMAVSVKTDPALSLGTPKPLFRSANLGRTFGRGFPWDIHPDGRRFLMIKPPAGADKTAGGSQNIIIVTNWNEELEKTLPVD